MPLVTHSYSGPVEEVLQQIANHVSELNNRVTILEDTSMAYDVVLNALRATAVESGAIDKSAWTSLLTGIADSLTENSQANIPEEMERIERIVRIIKDHADLTAATKGPNLSLIKGGRDDADGA